MSEEKRPRYLAKLGDGTVLTTVDDIENLCYRTLEEKKLMLTLELPVLLWIDIVSELRDRNPRNYSQLLRDDMMLRLEEAIERLHEETLFLVASGPAQTVSERFHPDRPRSRRELAGNALKRAEQERKPHG